MNLMAVLFVAVSANASIIPAGDAVSFLIPGLPALGPANIIVGWEFTPKVDTTANLLGFYDENHNGLIESHLVGLYDMSQNLLRSTTVTNADPYGINSTDHPNDGYLFKWAGITPILLTAGTHYVVAARTFSEINSDKYTYVAGSNFSEHWATFVTARSDGTSGSGLLFPGTITAFDKAYFGPNIGIAAIPEPSTCTYLLLGIALSTAGFVRRRMNNKEQ